MPKRRGVAAAAAASAQATPDTPLIARNALQRQIQRKSRRFLLFRIIGIIVLLSLIYIFFFRSSPKEAVKPPPGVDGQHILRIVAVGDLHGDYDNAFQVLKMADVVDEHGNWTGKVDYFVQTGDIVDRGLDTIKLYTFFEQLRTQARNAGGNVFSHMGNHEYMNVLSDWRYVSSEEIHTFGSIAKRQAAISTGFIGAAWAANYTAVSRIPLHPAAGSPNADYVSSSSPSPLSHAALSFMHGGLSPTYAVSYATPYPSRINGFAASLLRKCQSRQPQPSPHPPAAYAGLPMDATEGEAAFYTSDGPVWYRGWADKLTSDATLCPAAEAVMKQIGVKRMIMGHTPDFTQIVSRCGGKVIIIDTGISKAYGGRPSALSITYYLTPIQESFNFSGPSIEPSDNVTEPHVHGVNTTISNSTADVKAKKGKGVGKWMEQEIVKAIYPDEEVQIAADQTIITGDFW